MSDAEYSYTVGYALGYTGSGSGPYLGALHRQGWLDGREQYLIENPPASDGDTTELTRKVDSLYYFTDVATYSQQTLDFGDISAGNTFTLTMNGQETVPVTFTDQQQMDADIGAALLGLSAFEDALGTIPSDVGVVHAGGMTAAQYRVQIGGGFGSQYRGAFVDELFITSPFGFTPGTPAVVQTVIGGQVLDSRVTVDTTGFGVQGALEDNALLSAVIAALEARIVSLEP